MQDINTLKQDIRSSSRIRTLPVAAARHRCPGPREFWRQDRRDGTHGRILGLNYVGDGPDRPGRSQVSERAATAHCRHQISRGDRTHIMRGRRLSSLLPSTGLLIKRCCSRCNRGAFGCKQLAGAGWSRPMQRGRQAHDSRDSLLAAAVPPVTIRSYPYS